MPLARNGLSQPTARLQRDPARHCAGSIEENMMLYLPPPLAYLTNKVHCMDALELMRLLPARSVDMILIDPPYGYEKTKTAWDSNLAPINYSLLLTECLRAIRFRGAIVVFAAPPFSFELGMAWRDYYRYSWYYEKPRGSNFGNSAYQPLRVIEEILVFSKSIASANQYTSAEDVMNYHPPLVRLDRPYVREDKPEHKRIANPSLSSHVHNPQQYRNKVYEFATPSNLFYAAMDSDNDRGLHPTQKPLSICKYLISTYTQEGDLILDCYAGSGTTGVAARNLKRDYILGDTDAGYCAIARERLKTEFGSRKLGGDSDLSELPMFRGEKLHRPAGKLA